MKQTERKKIVKTTWQPSKVIWSRAQILSGYEENVGNEVRK